MNRNALLDISLLEPYWRQYPKDLIEKGEKYLAKHGYQDLTMKRLKGLVDGSDTDPFESNALTHSLDDQLNAEIVATARMVYLAKSVLETYEQHNIQATIELMFYLGRSEALAELFKWDTGLSPEWAINNDGFLEMAKLTNEYSNKYSKEFNELQTRMENTRNAKSNKLFERNKRICDRALELLGPGRGNKRKPCELPKLLESWCAEHFPDEAIGDKQIRRILRDAGILPPPKLRK